MNSLFHATFSWSSAVMLSLKNPLTFTQDVTDASVNNCCKLKLVFLEKRLWFSGRQYFKIRWGLYIKLKVSWPRALLWCVSHRKYVVCLGESRLSQVNNTPRANVFSAGVANFGKAMYRFVSYCVVCGIRLRDRDMQMSHSLTRSRRTS